MRQFKYPELDIVVISKNEENFIGKLLNSIKKQDYKGKLNIILSDAKSTDNTRLIAKRIIKDIHIVDGGFPGRGRNNGAKDGKSELILFLDSDVSLRENFLNSNIEEMYDREIDVCGACMFPESEFKLDKLMIGAYHIYAKSTQYFYPHAGGFCIFCKRWLFEFIDGFDEILPIAEDHNFVKRASKHGKFRMVNSVPVDCDMRRFDKDGRWVTIKNYIHCEIVRVFKGEMYDMKFEYILNGNEKNQ